MLSRLNYIKLQNIKLDRRSNEAIKCYRKIANPHVCGLYEDFKFRPAPIHKGKPAKPGPRNQYLKHSEIIKRNLGRHLPKTPNYILNAHLNGTETVYYTSKFKQTNGRYEVNIAGDIDVIKSQGIGSRTEAVKAVEVLNNTFGHSYVESSRGGHGLGWHFNVFIPEDSQFLYKESGDGYQLLNDFELTIKLRSSLKLIAEIIDQYLKLFCNIEMFEIKATPDAVEYDENGTCINIIRGELGMFPREISDPERLAEYNDRLRISIDDLLAICDKLQKILQQKGMQKTIKTKPSMQIGGSVGYKITDSDFAYFKSCEAFCTAMEWNHTHAGKKKLKCVNEDDRAVLLFVLLILQKQNAPETSVKTIIAMWKHIKKLGWTNRSPNSSRIATIRREFISAGLLHGENEYIVPNSIAEDGEVLKGKACRYELTQELNDLLSCVLLQSKVTPFFIHSQIRKLKFNGTAERPIRHRSQPPWLEKFAA